MLNIGIIGEIKTLEPYIRQIRKKRDIQLKGKSSVGISSDTDSSQFTIPEFNRLELIDRSDALIINNFSLFPFPVLCDIIKQSKHILAIEYPKLSVKECIQLLKLSNEAKTAFHFVNPFYFAAPVQWLNSNVKLPALFDISFFSNSYETRTTLIQLLLILKGLTGVKPRKTSAVAFQGDSKQSLFNNLNLQFSDASVVNLNFGKIEPENEFTIKVYSEGQFVSLNIPSKKFRINNKEIDLTSYPNKDELDIFIDSLNGKKSDPTDIDDYLAVLETLQEINKKISRFTSG